MGTNRHPSTLHRWKGLAKKYLGWATGDRSVEGEGLAEEHVRRAPTASEVDDARHEVRRRHDETLDEPRPDPRRGGGPPE